MADRPAAAPSKVKSSVPVPSGLIVMTPFDVFGVVMVNVCPSTANVPDVDCNLGEAEAKITVPVESI